jgi:hypothetical protein
LCLQIPTAAGLRDDVRSMSDGGEKPGRSVPKNSRGVLDNLPSTRPQRPSARRPKSDSSAQTPSPSPARSSPATATGNRKRATKPVAASPPSKRATTPAGAAATKKPARAKTTAPKPTRAKTTAAAAAGKSPRAKKTGGTATSKPTKPAATKAAKTTPREHAPDQGYEADLLDAVNPPSGAELARASVEFGGRALRAALSRLPRP